MEYPYYRDIIDKSTLRKKFYDYQNLQPIVNTRSENIADIYFDIITSDYDQTTDYFSEHVRVKCHKLKWKTKPLEQFAKYREKYNQIAKQEGKLKAKYSFAINALIDCDLFPTPVAYWIYRTYKPRSILDMCAGWGDRLIAAILYDPPENYTGVDPNSELHPCYRDMIDHYGVFQDKRKYNMIDSKFEDVKLDRKYDLMFTSPPYFSAEQHTDEEFGYDSLEGWLTSFLFPSIRKVYECLNGGGRAIIVISDLGEIKYVDRMIQYAVTCGFIYEGIIVYSHRAFGRGGERKISQNMYVFYKQAPYNTIINPPLVIRREQLTGTVHKTVYVFRDDYLNGGTKMRAAIKFLRKRPEKCIVYRGPTVGAAQIALAVACRILGKHAINIVNRWDKRHPNTDIASILGSEIVELEKPRNPKPNWDADIIESKTADCYTIPIGFEDEKYRELLSDALIEALPKDCPKISRMWVVSSTGNLLRALYKLFPKAHFNCVRVGFDHDSFIDKSNTTIYTVPEKFYQPAVHPPPYPSTSSYDAKIWQFIEEHAEDGDGIWNVA